ncbi:creatininase family protein [Streptomyces sp. NPDC055092]
MGSVPPDVLLRMFLFQLRAFANAGFRAVIALTGHHANQPDLRLVAEEFSRSSPVRVVAVSDPELVTGAYTGDHAGRYEISQLLAVRPDLVDLTRAGDTKFSPLGRFAQNPDAAQATAEHGSAVLEKSLDALKEIVVSCQPLEAKAEAEIQLLSIEETEQIWQRIAARSDEWCTLRE